MATIEKIAGYSQVRVEGTCHTVGAMWGSTRVDQEAEGGDVGKSLHVVSAGGRMIRLRIV